MDRQEHLPGLIESCIAGDEAARARFVVRYTDHVRRCVAHFLGNAASRPPVDTDVDDVSQEVFAHLLAKDCSRLKSVRRLDRIESWLSAICHNRVVDEIRRDGARNETLRKLKGNYESAAQLLMTTQPPDARAIAAERRNDLVDAMDELPERERLGVQLYYLDEMSYAEIADMTGRPLNTVASDLRRARMNLHRIMNRRGYGVRETGGAP